MPSNKADLDSRIHLAAKQAFGKGLFTIRAVIVSFIILSGFKPADLQEYPAVYSLLLQLRDMLKAGLNPAANKNIIFHKLDVF